MLIGYLRFDKREHTQTYLKIIFLKLRIFFQMKRKGLETKIPQYERKNLSLSIYKEYEKNLKPLRFLLLRRLRN